MYNLFPHFIHDQYQAQKISGSFKAVSLFLDIKGYTPMTAALMKHGREGAESLAYAIQNVFHPVIYAVYEQGGFIITFAGDAFTAIFPLTDEPNRDELLKICAMGLEMQEALQKHSRQETRFGVFELQGKIGLSYGDVSWGIIGPDPEKTYFFQGPAIDSCAAAEKQCTVGEVVITTALLDQLSDNLLHIEALTPDYKRLMQVNLTTNIDKTPLPPEMDLNIAKKFAPESLLQAKQVGEFREVISVFISFSGPETFQDLDQFISTVRLSVAEFSGHFARVDFGDKGGNILIFFGAPHSHENDLERALIFSLHLKKKLTTLTQAETKHLIPIQWRAGITRGVSYAGMVGVPLRCEYTALGDSINLSARLMMQADWGQILVPPDVAQNNKFFFRNIGTYQYKGIETPIATYELTGQRLVEEQVFDGPMIGRQTDLLALHTCIHPLFEDQFAGIIYIHGEAGIGKSRLIYEFKQQAKLAYNLTWYDIQIDQTLRKAFNPFIYLLKNYFNQTENASMVVRQEAFEIRYETLLDILALKPEAAELHTELARTKSILGALLGLSWPGSLYEALDAKGRHENTLYALKSFILAQTIFHPVVLNFEDGQWLDQDSLLALQTLVHNIEHYPLLILMTLRYDEQGQKISFEVGDIPQAHLDLNLLSPEDVYALAETTLSGPISPSLYESLQQKTHANPFYVQQLLRYLQEQDFLEQEGDAWQLKSNQVALPDSIMAVLIARIDRLHVRVRELVKTAAVQGRIFELELLARMLKTDISQPVRTATEKQIWNELNDLQYIFNHALLRDAAYNMQLRSHLRTLHAQVAELIEILYQDNLPEKYADIAFHYEMAEITYKTIDYLEKAGDHAQANYQNEQAIEFYQRLLNHLRQYGDISPAKIRVLLKQGGVLEVMGRWDQAISVNVTALELAEILEDQEKMASAYQALGDLVRKQGRLDQAMDLFERAEALYKTLDIPYGISTTTRWRGVVHAMRGEHERALTLFERSLALAETNNDPSGVSPALTNLGEIHRLLGHYQRAMAYNQQALQVQKELGDKVVLLKTMSNLALLYQNLGQDEAAKAHLDQALVLSQELGSKERTAVALNNLGLVHAAQRDYEAAMAAYEQAIAIATEIRDHPTLADGLHYQAEIHFEQKNYYAAQTHNQVSLDFNQRLRPNQVLVNQILAAKIDFALGYQTQAMEALKTLLEATPRFEDEASLYYELWLITGQETYRQEALSRYETLCAQTPNILYKKRLDVLKQPS